MAKILLIISLVLLTNCAYKPVIDTAGRSGTFDKDKAKEITNDIQHCDTLAKDNVNQVWDMPTRVQVKGRAFELYFRNRREPAVSESGAPYAVTLLDFVHERYEGTQTPKDFSSEIRLVNEGDGIDRELRIWMNNPLRYARRTFYQSGYLPDDGGTVLQVVRNDSWMIPYLSCMIVFIGMVAQFGLSLKRMRKRELS